MANSQFKIALNAKTDVKITTKLGELTNNIIKYSFVLLKRLYQWQYKIMI